MKFKKRTLLTWRCIHQESTYSTLHYNTNYFLPASYHDSTSINDTESCLMKTMHQCTRRCIYIIMIMRMNLYKLYTMLENSSIQTAFRLASQFNFTYRYIDDVLSINNPDFENYLGQMYPPELEIKDTMESNTSASYLDLLISISRDGQLHTSLYEERDDFNFHITNFPFLSSNIPSSPAYGVFISQLIRYAMASSSYECFILRAMRLSNKLLGQGYVRERLRSSLRKFYGRYGDLIKQYEVPLSRMLHDILDDDHLQ